jgi:hypothetical protein
MPFFIVTAMKTSNLTKKELSIDCTSNMKMDLLYTGKQEHNNYDVRRNLEGICGQRVSAARCAIFFGGSKTMVTAKYADNRTICINRKFLQKVTEVYKHLCTQFSSGVTEKKTIHQSY